MQFHALISCILCIFPSLLLFPLSLSLPFLSLPLALFLATEIPSRGEAGGKASLSLFSLSLSLATETYVARRDLSLFRSPLLPLFHALLFSLSRDGNFRREERLVSLFSSSFSFFLPHSLPLFPSLSLSRRKFHREEKQEEKPLLLLSIFLSPSSLSLYLSLSRDGNSHSPFLLFFFSFSLPLSSSFLSPAFSPSLSTSSPFLLSLARAHARSLSRRKLFPSREEFSRCLFLLLIRSSFLPLSLSFSLLYALPCSPSFLSLFISLSLSPLRSSLLSQFPLFSFSSSLLSLSLYCVFLSSRLLATEAISVSSFPLSLSRDGKSPSRDCGLTLSLSLSLPSLLSLSSLARLHLLYRECFWPSTREKREKGEDKREERGDRKLPFF